jgi:hypothetical protein
MPLLNAHHLTVSMSNGKQRFKEKIDGILLVEHHLPLSYTSCPTYTEGVSRSPEAMIRSRICSNVAVSMSPRA